MCSSTRPPRPTLRPSAPDRPARLSMFVARPASGAGLSRPPAGLLRLALHRARPGIALLAPGRGECRRCREGCSRPSVPATCGRGVEGRARTAPHPLPTCSDTPSKADDVMTEIASTYAADAIAAGMSTYPHPKPILDMGALAEVIRVQFLTWAGIQVPDPETVAAAPADSIARLLGELTERVHLYGVEADGDAEPWGLAHLFNAHADALYAAHGRGHAHLLGTLYSLIAARAHLRDGHEGRFELDPFGGDRYTINEKAL